MTFCLITKENGELAVNLAIEKFLSVELEDNNLVINGIIKIPTENILEIKTKGE